MTIRRIIGLVFLASALMFGAADLWHSIVPYAYGSEAITMGRLWILVSVHSLQVFERVVQGLWAPMWDFGFSPLLIAPAWSFFGVLGLLFLIFGREKIADRR
jgi:hypothetical protein